MRLLYHNNNIIHVPMCTKDRETFMDFNRRRHCLHNNIICSIPLYIPI